VTIYKFAGGFGALGADICDLGRMTDLLLLANEQVGEQIEELSNLRCMSSATGSKAAEKVLRSRAPERALDQRAGPALACPAFALEYIGASIETKGEPSFTEAERAKSA
jgi:hypothetical protein